MKGVTSVSDWIVELVAAFTMILIGAIGYLVDDKLDAIYDVMIEQNNNQKETSRELGKINGTVQLFSSEISRLKAVDSELKLTDREISIKVDGINKRVYQLEGAK